MPAMVAVLRGLLALAVLVGARPLSTLTMRHDADKSRNAEMRTILSGARAPAWATRAAHRRDAIMRPSHGQAKNKVERNADRTSTSDDSDERSLRFLWMASC